ncbi:MAG: RNA polymerase sigma-70 factor [Spirosomataceae bacterium]
MEGFQPIQQPTESPFGSEHSSKVLDAELLIKRTFLDDPDQGMAMLFRTYYNVLCSHAVRFVASKAIAEDLVSDIFYEFQVNQLYHTVKSSFRAYLFASVRNRAFDYVKAEMRRSASLDGTELFSSPTAQEPDSITQYEDLYHDVEKAINEMPHKRRQIYVMHRFEGKKYQEIADELNLSLHTVEAHLYQAIKQIRNSLQSKWLVLAIGFFQNWF